MMKNCMLQKKLFLLLLFMLQSAFFSFFLFSQEVNCAAGKPISANGYTQVYVPQNAVDKNTATYWEGANDGRPDVLTVDLGSAAAITKVVIKLNPAAVWGPRTQVLSLEGSTNNSTYTVLKSQASYNFDPATGNSVTIPVSATTRYVRLTIASNSGAPAGQVAEFEVWGTGGTGQMPFGNGGNPWPVRDLALIQAENYDTGGPGVAYQDDSGGNTGGAYRYDDVDIENCTDGSTGYNVGWIRQGEWLEYTVEVTAGVYDIVCRAASSGSLVGDLRLSLDNRELGIGAISNTGGWQTYQDFTLSKISLESASKAVLRLEAVNGGDFNLNYVKFVKVVPVETYHLTINNGSGDGDYAQGTVVPIVFQAPNDAPQGSHYVFDLWEGDVKAANPTAPATTVIMPGYAAQMTPVFHLEADNMKYSLTVNGGSGSGSYYPGARIAVTADDNTFKYWSGDTYILDSATSRSTYVTMPAANVTITAVAGQVTQTYEAEKAVLSGGAKINNNHGGFSGTGFVDGYWQQGASTAFTVNVSEAGYYGVTLGYGNGFGESNISIYVNGVKAAKSTLPSTGAWTTWGSRTENLELKSGVNTISYVYDQGDSANINLDYISIGKPTLTAPDLLISSISWSPALPEDGRQVVFKAIVKNKGTGALEESTNVLFMIDGKPVSESYSLSYLARNAETEVEAIVEWSGAPGSYQVSAVVDHEEYVAELNELNNSAAKTITVSKVRGADLVIGSISYNPANIMPGDKVTFNVTVVNQGLDPTANANCVVRLTIGSGTVLTGSYQGVIAGDNNPAAREKVIVISGTWSPATNGNYLINAVVDPDNYIQETHEDNNTNSTSIFIGRGARVPWIEYEAEKGRTNAQVLAPNRILGDHSGEASGRSAVKLTSTGHYVEWTTTAQANSIVIRNSIPDTADGSGMDATISMYVNNVHKADIMLSSKSCWVYGGDAFQYNSPGSGAPRRIYDESHMLFDFSIPAGAVVRLQKDSGDSAAYYAIDLVDLEQVDAPKPMPTGYISITDPSLNQPAVPNDQASDQMAIEECIRKVQSGQYKGVYLPRGTFIHQNKILINGVTIQGAGMWYSRLYCPSDRSDAGWGDTGFNINGDNCQFRDFMIEGTTNGERERGGKAFVNASHKNMVIDNMWIEHVVCAYWVGGNPESTNLRVSNSRFRNTGADAINLCNGSRDSVIENCTARNTGDDAFAIWSATDLYPHPSTNNVIKNCTVQIVWRAACFAIYGGVGNRIENCVGYDALTYPGMTLSSEFDPFDMEGLTVDGVTLIRCGGEYWQDAGNPAQKQKYGAIWIFAATEPFNNVVVKNVDIIDPTFYGIVFQSRNGTINNAQFDNITIQNPPEYGIFVWGYDPWQYPSAGTRGSATFKNSTITGAGKGKVANNSASFNLINGGGNNF